MNANDRREFLRRAASGLIVVTGAAGAAQPPAKDEKKPDSGDEDVSPAEDLMREHGVLKRVLLVYEEAIRRIDAKEDLPPEPLADAAGMIRSFIEDYHEKLEEDFLFPRFRKAHKHVELVEVLVAQHQAGRRLTETAMHLATASALKDDDDRRKLVRSLRSFVRMYSPHEAREDTVLFPALHDIVSRNEYDSLGEDFEKKEHELLGQDGFEGMVAKIEGIERKLGIYELSQFTPKE